MMFRIQKLLMSEYDDLEEEVLVESSFAQVLGTGKGVRQVQIALTPTKLIIGADIFDKSITESLSNVVFQNQDPEIESMELVNIFPLDFLYISIFRKGNRQLMKVVVGSYKVLLFEFGGHILKNLFWNIWRDRIAKLRSYQRRQTILSTSSSSETFPKLQIVEANVHREPCDHVKYGKNFDEKEKDPLSMRRVSYLESDSLKSSGKFLTTESLSLPRTARNNRALREVAKYLVDTQNDIMTYNTSRDF